MMNLFKFFVRRKRFNTHRNAVSIVESIAKCKSLYKGLIRDVHPDRHPENAALAEEFTQLINKYRYNYAELIKLKSRIEKEFL